MLKMYAKYMKNGKLVKSSWTDEVYQLIENMDAEKGTVKAVAVKNSNRYDTLCAWLRNWNNDKGFRERFSGNIEDCKIEKENYEQVLKISDVTPANVIRFITSGYKTKFTVGDLSKVKVNGRTETVAYIDGYHFCFVESNDVFHICEFAEFCERSGIEVKPAN